MSSLSLSLSLSLGPSGFPHQFRGNPLSSHSVLFYWDPVQEGQRNGPITSYVISSLDLKGGNQILVHVQSSPYNLSGLSPYTDYEFFITAANSIGFGPSSPGIIVKTLPDGRHLSPLSLSSFSNLLFISFSSPLLSSILYHYVLILLGVCLKLLINWLSDLSLAPFIPSLLLATLNGDCWNKATMNTHTLIYTHSYTHTHIEACT